MSYLREMSTQIKMYYDYHDEIYQNLDILDPSKISFKKNCIYWIEKFPNKILKSTEKKVHGRDFILVQENWKCQKNIFR